MEEHKFPDSNLDFKELREIYIRLDPTTYRNIYDFGINIYENCNLRNSENSEIFSIPLVNIRLSSFRNNYIGVPIQDILDLNTEFYDTNRALFTTVTYGTETYINNINLTDIITRRFVNPDRLIPFSPSKIIIKIDLPYEIVAKDDVDDSGALQIDMQSIYDHFHSEFDTFVFHTLELDIRQYVTGKHGTLDPSTNLAAIDTPVHRGNGLATLDLSTMADSGGGNGQAAMVDSAGPAINITAYDHSSPYFTLNIITNGMVIGGFGASGGNGGNGKQNLGDWGKYDEAKLTSPYIDNNNRVVASYSNVDPEGLEIPKRYELKLTFKHADFPDVTKQLLNNDGSKYFNDYRKLQTVVDDEGYHYPIHTAGGRYEPFHEEIVTFRMDQLEDRTEEMDSRDDTTDSGTYSYNIEVTWSYWERIASSPDEPSHSSSDGEEGSKANYSCNVDKRFISSDGTDGTDYNGTGGAGGKKGDDGGIINIVDVANINIIESY
jgi:hypothetical protein